ncbi:MAG: hypothetical protein KDE27_17045 [Planctomycetes bacterium]|nr:hypothetical protein [Planctomycetota bacterium]
MIHRVCATFLVSLLLIATASAQVGWRDEALPNPTTGGSATLLARCYYPALQSGQNAPLLPRPGGYPIVVFLHGYGGLGRNYPDLGERLAAAGYLAVLSDTAMTDPTLQAADAAALLPALALENQRIGAFLYGALATDRAALAGHSMGGGNTVRTLATNPGYRTGIGFAPWAGQGSGTQSWFPSAFAPLVAVPLLLLHGEGDTTLNWQTTAQAYYDRATAYTDAKVFVRLDGDCTHSNVARLTPSSGLVDRAVFDRSLTTAIGWLDAVLGDDPRGLEQVVGPTLRAAPHFAEVAVAIRAPQLWTVGEPRVGGAIGFRLAGEPGIAALALALTAGNVATPIGTLVLDPATTVVIATAPVGATNLQLTPYPIPADAALVGLRVFAQGAASTDGGGLRLSNGLDFVIGT